MQIEQIILYSVHGKKRQLRFNLGGLNVISGDSETGKSALVPIIDYCFAGTEFEVPDNVIADSVSWYGIVLVHNETRTFIGRPAPEDGSETSERAMLLSPAPAELPEFVDLAQNTNVEALRDFLANQIGIDRAGPKEMTVVPATIRQALLLSLQAQDEIATKKYLFHNHDHHWVAQGLKETFPYFLGAISADTVLISRRLAKRKAAKREAAAALALLEQSDEKILPRLRSLLSEAVHAELLPPGANNAPTLAMAFNLAADAIDTTYPLPPVSTDGPELPRLEYRRRELTSKYRVLRDEMALLEARARDENRFGAEVGEQVARLKTIGMLPHDHDGTTCPLCGSGAAHTPEASDVRALLGTLSSQLSSVVAAAPHLTEAREQLRDEAASVRSEIESVSSSIEQLLRQEREMDQAERILDRQSFVRGKLAEFLSTQTVPNDDDLTAARERLEIEEAAVAELDRELAQFDVDERTRSILNSLRATMASMATHLKLEYTTELGIDPKLMTVVADTRKGRRPMNKLGGGKNWVGYHLVAHLALHELMIEENRPVPRFLVLDQMTQAFYPAKSTKQERDEAIDKDSDAVLSMFDLLKGFSDQHSGAFQIIVLEHAMPPESWDDSVLIGEWRDGHALIPREWIEELGLDDKQ